MKIVNPIDITMNNCCLKKTDSLKYHGVIIDHKLNWSQHIAHVKNKDSKGIGIMYRARSYLTKSCLRKLYFSYIYPYLIYCIEIWGTSPQSHRPLLLLQKKIVRIMTFSTYYAHTYPLFKDLNIFTIDKLVVHRIGIAIYKINNDLFPSVLNELYKKNNIIHNDNIRTKDMFLVSLGTQTFSTVRARIWNALIVKFNVNVPLTRFKVSLKQYLSSNILTISYPK